MKKYRLCIAMLLCLMTVVLFHAFPMDWQLERIARKGDVWALKAYLRCGVNPNRKLKYGFRMLHHAGMAGHVEFCQVLLDGGASVEVRDGKFGETPIAYTTNGILLIRDQGTQGVDTQRHRIDLLRIMQHYMKTSPLNSAIADGDLSALQTLIEQGTDVNSADIHGFLPLVTAVLHQRTAAFDLLLSKGAAPCVSSLENTRLRGSYEYVLITPIGAAVIVGSNDWLESVLLRGGCIDDRPESMDITPGAIADRLSNVEAYRYLVSHGAKYRSEAMDLLLNRSARL